MATRFGEFEDPFYVDSLFFSVVFVGFLICKDVTTYWTVNVGLGWFCRSKYEEEMTELFSLLGIYALKKTVC